MKKNNAREDVEQRIDLLKESMTDRLSELASRGHRLHDKLNVQQQISEQPITAVVAAFAGGFLLQRLLTRSRQSSQPGQTRSSASPGLFDVAIRSLVGTAATSLGAQIVDNLAQRMSTDE